MGSFIFFYFIIVSIPATFPFNCNLKNQPRGNKFWQS